MKLRYFIIFTGLLYLVGFVNSIIAGYYDGLAEYCEGCSEQEITYLYVKVFEHLALANFFTTFAELLLVFIVLIAVVRVIKNKFRRHSRDAEQ